MSKLFFLIFILLLLPFSAIAAPEVTSQISTYDFGEVAQGDKVNYTFLFKNTGDELLEISSVSSSCGCTAAMLSAKRLAPGEVGEIKATFDSSRFRGKVTKTITLISNAASQPKLIFKLEGRVKELLSLSTDRVSWVWKTADQTGTSSVVISNQSPQTVVLQDPRTTSPQLKVELDKKELPPGEQATLSVSGSLAPGTERLNGYLMVGTNFTPMPQLRISVSGRLVK